MKENSAYKEVTLIKDVSFTGRVRKKGTVMSVPLDAARQMAKDGLIKVTKKKAIEPID